MGNPSWHDIVAALAGADGEMNTTDGADWDANVIAEVVVPGAVFRSRGDDDEEAWCGVAHRLGELRLVQGLEAAAWTDIDEVIDQVRYVVARDTDGSLWAIGVAAADGERRGYIADDIAYDQRAFDRVAFLEPIDCRDVASIVATLGAGRDRTTAGPSRRPRSRRSRRPTG